MQKSQLSQLGLTKKSVESYMGLTKKSVLSPISSFWKEEYPQGEVVGKKMDIPYFTYHPGLKTTPPS